jgi:teichuronic acid exporter
LDTEPTVDRSLGAGLAWTAAFRWLAQAVSWAATFYAARILAPGDYGLAAMAMVPIGLVRLVEDLGFDSVILQNRQLTPLQVSRLAGLALIVAAALCGALIAAASWIADFYREPGVAALVSFACTIIVFDALQIVPRAMLQRQLRFRALALLYFTQVVVTSATLVVCARMGLGEWSLIANNLAGAAVATVVLMFLYPYMPRIPREFSDLKASLVSGWRMLISRASWYTYSNADSAVVGRMLGKDSLGVYGFALTLANTPIQEIGSVFSKVVPGVFASVQDQRSELKRYFLLLTEAVTTIAFPASVGITLVAPQLVPLALGDQWLAVIAPLQALCGYTMLYAAQLLVSHVILWTGHFRANMWLSIAAALTLPLAFWVGTRWGLLGVAIAWAIGFALITIPAVEYARRLINVSWGEYVAALTPASLSTAAMGLAVWYVSRSIAPTTNAWMSLAMLVGVGVLAYTAVHGLLFRHRVWRIVRVVRGEEQLVAVSAPS